MRGHRPGQNEFRRMVASGKPRAEVAAFHLAAVRHESDQRTSAVGSGFGVVTSNAGYRSDNRNKSGSNLRIRTPTGRNHAGLWGFLIVGL
jgi:hypothetical protein